MIAAVEVVMRPVRPNSEITITSVCSSRPRWARSARTAENDRSNSSTCSRWKSKFSLCVS